MAKLSTPWFRVILDDDTEHTVRALNIDMVSFDRERARHKDWPTLDEGPAFSSTWLAWHALQRVNAIPKMAFGEFETKALQVEGITDEDMQKEQLEAEVDPTPLAAEPA